MAKLTITGDKKIDRIIRQLRNPKVTNKIVNQAMRSALKPIRAAAKANAPQESGRLAKAIKIRVIRSRKGIRLAVSILAKDLDGGKAYGAAVEYGNEGQEPQAPMRKAYDALATTARDQVLAEVKTNVLAAARE